MDIEKAIRSLDESCVFIASYFDVDMFINPLYLNTNWALNGQDVHFNDADEDEEITDFDDFRYSLTCLHIVEKEKYTALRVRDDCSNGSYWMIFENKHRQQDLE